MAEIIVLSNQADDLATSNENLPARAIGWVKSLRSLNFAEDAGSGVRGSVFQVPSTVGNGFGRRVVSAAHGLSAGQPLRLHAVGGVAKFDLAISSADKALLATHVVVDVVDSNTFDVAQGGAWAVPGLTVGDQYLSDAAAGTLVATAPTANPAQRVGVYDGTSLHLTITPPGGDSTDIDTLVQELDARTDLTAIPKGAAGGDLAETYANPVVKQITGVGAALMSVDTDVSYTEDTRESDPPSGGRGVCPGRHFRTINGTATDERCWCASDEYGEAFWSHDYFAHTVKDTSIRTAGPTVSGSACYRWGTRRFVYIAGSINSYVWLTGCGRSSGEGSSGMPGVFYAKHEAASYAADGSMLESAWHYLAWSTVGGVNGINGLNKAAAHDGVLVWIGDSRYIARTTTFADDAFVADGGSSGYRFSGVATDSCGNWGALGQWGDIWKSMPVDGVEGTAFTKLESVNVSIDGGKTYTSAAKLPGGDMGGLRWSSLLCCYGLWLAIVYVPGTSGYAYAYSEDFENWIVYSGSALTRFYDASTDGVRWFATNLYPSSAGANAVPPIYQLLVDSINVKRRLNLEKGMAVSGPVYMLDLPNAKMIGTDENGREVDASQLLALDDLKDVDTATTAPTNGQVLEFDAASGLWVPKTISAVSDHLVLSSEVDTVAARLGHKILNAAGEELATQDHSTYGKALVLPAAAASSPIGYELFPISLTDNTTSMGASGTWAFAFHPNATFSATKIRIAIAVFQNANLKLGLFHYDSTTRIYTCVSKGTILGSAIVNGINTCILDTPIQLQGGQLYYLALYQTSTTNIYFVVSNRTSNNTTPMMFLSDPNDRLTEGTTITVNSTTQLRPWMEISQ